MTKIRRKPLSKTGGSKDGVIPNISETKDMCTYAGVDYSHGSVVPMGGTNKTCHVDNKGVGEWQ